MSKLLQGATADWDSASFLIVALGKRVPYQE